MLYWFVNHERTEPIIFDSKRGNLKNIFFSTVFNLRSSNIGDKSNTDYMYVIVSTHPTDLDTYLCISQYQRPKNRVIEKLQRQSVYTQ